MPLPTWPETSPGAADPGTGLPIGSVALSDLCEIHRATKATDGQGGRRMTWATLAEDVPCFIQMGNSSGQQRLPTPKEGVVGGKMRPVEVWSAIFQIGQDVRAQDRVVKGDYTWEVLDVSGGETGATSLQAVLTRIGPQGA